MKFIGALLVACVAHNILVVSSSGVDLLQESFQPGRNANPLIIDESSHNGTSNEASDSSQHQHDETQNNDTFPNKIIENRQTHTDMQSNDQTINKTPNFIEAPYTYIYNRPSKSFHENQHFEDNSSVSQPLNPSHSQNLFTSSYAISQSFRNQADGVQSSSYISVNTIVLGTTPYNSPSHNNTPFYAIIFNISQNNTQFFGITPYNKPPHNLSDQFQNKNCSGQPNVSDTDCRNCEKTNRRGMAPANGRNAEPDQFPHAVAIGWKFVNRTDYSWACGGSLISVCFVLTAAHCANNGNPAIVQEQPEIVRLGELDFDDDNGDTQDIAIQEFIIHPDYKPPSKYHDIALIRLAKPAVFGKSVRPTCLWRQETIPENSTLTAIGWGALGDGGATAKKLQKVDLEEVTQEVCNESYGRRFLKMGIISKQICAKDANMDTCEGDSGGALTVENDDYGCENHNYLVGVTSFGSACGLGIPGVYTRVSSYLDWIEGHVWPQGA